MRKILLALTITLILSLASGGVLVFAANAAAPGDLLYGVDRGLEAVQLGLTPNQHSALLLQSRFAFERLGELQSLTARGDQQYLADTLAELAAALSTLEAAVEAGDLEPESVAGLVNAAFMRNLNLQDESNGNGNPDDDPDDGGEEAGETMKDGAYCQGQAEKHHPTGDKLAQRYQVGYEEVMGWFCDGGYGFGEIDLAYSIAGAAGVPVTEVFDLRASGVGWGNVLKEYGLDKKPDKPPKPDNANGNAYGHDKDKDKDKDKVKDKDKDKDKDKTKP